jgi:hypothetical protein
MANDLQATDDIRECIATGAPRAQRRRERERGRDASFQMTVTGLSMFSVRPW